MAPLNLNLFVGLLAPPTGGDDPSGGAKKAGTLPGGVPASGSSGGDAFVPGLNSAGLVPGVAEAKAPVVGGVLAPVNALWASAKPVASKALVPMADVSTQALKWLKVDGNLAILDQGASKPGWVAHHEKTKKFILEAAQSISSSPENRQTVLVLGAGVGSDIPIAELAERFDVVLIDINESALKRAMSRVPSHLRSHVKYEVKDISGGMVDRIINKAQEVLARQKDPAKAVDEFGTFFEQLELPTVDFSSGYSHVAFIISSQVVTPYLFNVVSVFLDIVEKKGLNVLENPTAISMLKRLAGKSHVAHARSLKHFVTAKQGTVFFSSEVTQEKNPLIPGPSKIDLLQDEEGKTVEDVKFYFEGEKGLAVAERFSWDWILSNTDDPGPIREIVSRTAPHLIGVTLATQKVQAVVLKPPVSDAVEKEKERVASIITAENIKRAMLERVSLTSDEIVSATAVIRVAQQLNPMSLAELQQRTNYTEFLRFPQEWVYLRENVIPSFAGQKEIIIGDFGPGYFKTVDGRPMTFEPFQLASLDSKVKVRIYDKEETPFQVLRDFKGEMWVRLNWVPLEKHPDDPVYAFYFERLYGEGWRETLAAQKRAYEDFLKASGATVDPVLEMRPDQSGTPFYYTKIKFPDRRLLERMEPQPKGDIVLTPVQLPPMDIAYLRLNQAYLDGPQKDALFSLSTLVRIVDALKPGGYLFTDWREVPVQGSPEYRFINPHSPDAHLMTALGLVQENPVLGCEWVVLKKVGPSNEFVKRLMVEVVKGLGKEVAHEPVVASQSQATDLFRKIVPAKFSDRENVWTRIFTRLDAMEVAPSEIEIKRVILEEALDVRLSKMSFSSAQASHRKKMEEAVQDSTKRRQMAVAMAEKMKSGRADILFDKLDTFFELVEVLEEGGVWVELEKKWAAPSMSTSGYTGFAANLAFLIPDSLSFKAEIIQVTVEELGGKEDSESLTKARVAVVVRALDRILTSAMAQRMKVVDETGAFMFEAGHPWRSIAIQALAEEVLKIRDIANIRRYLGEPTLETLRDYIFKEWQASFVARIERLVSLKEWDKREEKYHSIILQRLKKGHARLLEEMDAHGLTQPNLVNHHTHPSSQTSFIRHFEELTLLKRYLPSGLPRILEVGPGGIDRPLDVDPKISPRKFFHPETVELALLGDVQVVDINRHNVESINTYPPEVLITDQNLVFPYAQAVAAQATRTSKIGRYQVLGFDHIKDRIHAEEKDLVTDSFEVESYDVIVALGVRPYLKEEAAEIAMLQYIRTMKMGGLLVDTFSVTSDTEVAQVKSYFKETYGLQILEINKRERDPTTGRTAYTFVARKGKTPPYAAEGILRLNRAQVRARVDYGHENQVTPPASLPPGFDTDDMQRSLASDSPYRTPAYDAQNPTRFKRSVPGTPENIQAAEIYWRRNLSEANLRQTTQETLALSPEAYKAAMRARLGMGTQAEDYMLTLSGFNNRSFIVDIFKSSAAAVPEDHPLQVGIFGGGWVSLQNPPRRTFEIFPLIGEILKSAGVSIEGMTMEPYEVLIGLLQRFKNSRLQVYDREPQLIQLLQSPDASLIWPLFHNNGTLGKEGNQKLAREFLQKAEATKDQIHTHPTRPELHAAIFKLKEDDFRKISAHQVDLATQLFDKGTPEPELDFGLSLWTSYFMHPVLQRAAFIKMVDRMKLNGVFISDYCLTDAEAKLLGLEIVNGLDLLTSQPMNQSDMDENSQDRAAQVYMRKSVTPYFKEAMEMIRRVQKNVSVDNDPPPSPGGGVQVFRGGQAMVQGGVLLPGAMKFGGSQMMQTGALQVMAPVPQAPVEEDDSDRVLNLWRGLLFKTRDDLFIRRPSPHRDELIRILNEIIKRNNAHEIQKLIESLQGNSLDVSAEGIIRLLELRHLPNQPSLLARPAASNTSPLMGAPTSPFLVTPPGVAPAAAPMPVWH